jgi:hypothetical protein
VTLAALRDRAVARSLREDAALRGALDALGFVQADPMRAPAPVAKRKLGCAFLRHAAGQKPRRSARMSAATIAAQIPSIQGTLGTK